MTVNSPHNADTFIAGLRSFVNESRLLAQFDSPSLVKVYRFWEANGTAYMVMPYYEGTTLKQAFKQGRIVPTRNGSEVFWRTCSTRSIPSTVCNVFTATSRPTTSCC